ncbi:MAG TPA: DUF6221 family protein [Pseudonocardiaceae bacterium]|nr:DUF6221 family protein [Pseudonocardiaceae bacterium]
MTDDLVAFLRARIAEDEQGALAACGVRGQRVPAGGEHWRWERSHYNDPLADTPVDIEAGAAARDEFLAEGADVGLRSIEEYPFLATPGSGPHLVLSGTEEVEVGVGVHVARHDPNRVLRGVEAKRQIVEAWRAAKIRKVTSGRNYGRWTDGQPDRQYPVLSRLPTYATERELLGLELALRLLASEWSDHPDHRQEWTP